MSSYAGILALLQTDPQLLDQLQRIATAQTILAVVAALIMLLVIGGALLSFRTMRSMARLLRSFEQVAQDLGPRVEPLIEKASRIADDANDVSDSLRRKVHELTGTVEELNLALRRASRDAQRRAREFGAVIDVVQEEAESLLLDAAATARGVHATADALRNGPARSVPGESGRTAPVRDVSVSAGTRDVSASAGTGENQEVL